MRKSTLFLWGASLFVGCFYAVPALAQRTDVNEVSTLNAVIPDFQVNENTGPNGALQYNPSMAMNRNGNFIITWEDTRDGDYDIFAQRYSSGRTATGGNFKVNDDTENANQDYPSIATDESGNFMITWRDNRHGDLDIFAQRYSSEGAALGSNFKVNDDTESAGQYLPSIAADGNGSFTLTWVDGRNGGRDIYDSVDLIRFFKVLIFVKITCSNDIYQYFYIYSFLKISVFPIGQSDLQFAQYHLFFE